MKKTKKLKLIEGTFMHDDAKEILMNVFSTKIQYHKLKNFSSQERLGKDDVFAKKRIQALKKEIVKFQKLISEAETSSNRIVISSEIFISIDNDK